MVYDNFILSLQLEPVMFNPFTASSDVQADSDSSEEEGDAYILADDIDSSQIHSAISEVQTVQVKSESNAPVDTLTDEVSENQKCYYCSHRQRSLDPYDSSDTYVCSVDGSPINCHYQDDDACFHFEEAVTEAEDDDFI